MLPLHLLEKSLGARVQLDLSDGQALTGTLAGFDEHMNVVLTDAASGGKALGTVVVRGNHVVRIGL